MIRTLLCCFLFVMGSSSYAQRTYTILRLDEAPVIDGVLDEAVWGKVNIADDFTVNSPLFGEKSKFLSEYLLYYDIAFVWQTM